MKMKMWKIRNKETGEFSKGGSSTWNIWTKGGKTWTNIGHVKSHLNTWVYINGELKNGYPYHNAEIVEVEVELDDCFAYPVSNVVDIMLEQKEDRAKQEEIMHQKWIELRERKQLEELRKKYEGK
jgi:hypothetical protein